jgi:S1-C subfamily serine protease
VRFLIIGMALCLTASRASGEDWDPVWKIAKKSTVFIEATITTGPTGSQFTRYGTGFVLDQSGLVLTAYHTIASKTCDEAWGAPAPCTVDEIILKARTGSVFAAPEDVLVLAQDENFDMALLKLRDSSKGRRNKLPLGNSEDMQSGDPISIGAWDRVIDWQPRFGSLSQTDTSLDKFAHVFLLHALDLNPGDSGAPLITVNGEVVAVALGVLVHNKNVGIGVPINLAKTTVLQQLTAKSVNVAPVNIVRPPAPPEGASTTPSDRPKTATYSLSAPVTTGAVAAASQLNSIPIASENVKEQTAAASAPPAPSAVTITRVLEAIPGHRFVSWDVANIRSASAMRNVVVESFDKDHKLRLTATVNPVPGQSNISASVQTVQIRDTQ